MAFADIRQDIINGLDSAQLEALGWNAQVRDTLPVSAVVRTSATVVTITLPASPSYDITAQETITVTVPVSALALSVADVVADAPFTIEETTFNALRQAIIDGLDSGQAEATGWNALVRDTLPVSAVVRTSDTEVTITLPATPAYDITFPETITATVPAGVLLSTSLDIVATPTFEVEIIPSGAFDDVRQAIINGITSAQAEALGWNAQVRDNLPVSAVVRTSDTVVTVTLLPGPTLYDITAPETITVTVPAAALTTSLSDIVAEPTFDVSSGTQYTLVAEAGVFVLTGLPATLDYSGSEPVEEITVRPSDNLINVYDVGDVVRLRGVFLNIMAVETDPDSVTLKVSSPSVTTTYVYPTHIVKDSVATYHYDYAVAERGDFYYLWLATGTGQAAERGQFVVEASMVQ